jgi:cysteine sulfinate desulfinase/cysteine desulfurase-like protein
MRYFTTEWGNPSSAYKFGYKIKSAIETALAAVNRAGELLRV